MKKILPLILVGVLIGGGTVETYHFVRDRHRRDRFEQRLRCKTLADSYAANNSTDRSSIFVDRVDFSTSHNSCVASISKTFFDEWNYEVLDVVTGETLYSGACSGAEKSSLYCGNGRDISLMEKRDKAFDESLK